jgi:uncharacterized protein (DUF488 family)
MGTAEFAQGLRQLLDLASGARTVIMCAEALWWRCHRSMIADTLCVRGVEVVHIVDARHETVHPMTSAAHIVRGQLSYAGISSTEALRQVNWISRDWLASVWGLEVPGAQFE